MNDTPNCTHRQFTESQSYCPDCGLSRSEVLVAACEPYLKDEETPAECIARNRRDVDGCLTMLVAEKRKTEALQARLAEAEAEALLRELDDCGAIANWMRVSDDLRARIDAFLAPDSADDPHLQNPRPPGWERTLEDILREQRTGDSASGDHKCDCWKHEHQVCDICQGIVGKTITDQPTTAVKSTLTGENNAG